MKEMITIPKKDYIKLQQEANIDKEFLKDLIQGLKEVKEGKISRLL